MPPPTRSAHISDISFSLSSWAEPISREIRRLTGQSCKVVWLQSTRINRWKYRPMPTKRVRKGSASRPDRPPGQASPARRRAAAFGLDHPLMPRLQGRDETRTRLVSWLSAWVRDTNERWPLSIRAGFLSPLLSRIQWPWLSTRWTPNTGTPYATRAAFGAVHTLSLPA